MAKQRPVKIISDVCSCAELVKDISPTPPLIFTGVQKVQNLASSCLWSNLVLKWNNKSYILNVLQSVDDLRKFHPSLLNLYTG